jgi:O-antigen/teichoic acid export membrane protein
VSLRRGVFGGAAAVGAGKVLGQGASFARSVVIARLLGVEDVGVAALFAMTVALFSMITDLATNRLLVQAPDGDDERLQASVHLFAVAQGAIAATLIFALAGPIARLFGATEATWAFRTIAALPLITALRHEDVSRFQRVLRFRPYVTMEVSSQVMATVAAIPLAFALRDYSAMVWVLFVQQVTLVVASHLLAERRYRWALDRAMARRIMAFGWPLLLNGLLMFGVFWGDRAIVGAMYTQDDLGVYSVAFQLTILLAFAVVGVVSSVALPTLASVQDDQAALERRYSVLAQGLSLVGALLVIPFALAGGWVITVIYGEKYAAAGAFVGWLAAAQALRLVRVAPTLAALARADTMNSLVANIARALAVPAALLAAWRGAGLEVIAMMGFLGELLAIGVATHRLWRRQAVPALRTLGPGLLVIVAGGAAWGLSKTDIAHRSPVIILAIMGALGVGMSLLTLAACRALRSEWRVFVHAASRRLAERGA